MSTNFQKIVSVIMPAYNAERFIDESIRSVISQTYPYWELLIVDDCSNDNSAIIIKKYVEEDNRIVYFKTEQPSGSPYIPRNIGIQNASGRYIAFLDSDDAWLPHKLEEQLPLFDNDHTVIVFSNYEKMNEIGDRNERYINAPAFTNYKKLLRGNVIGCMTAMYDTSKVGKVYFENINHEDYVMWLSILKWGYIARNTNTVTALYRIRRKSVSSNKLKVLSWQWNIYVNVEKTGYLKAICYFCHYACKAFVKSKK